MTPDRLDHLKALEAVHAGRLHHEAGFVQIPTAALIERIDIGMPQLPPVALFQWAAAEEGKRPGDPILLRPADQPYSALALSLHDSVWVREEDLPILRAHAEAKLIRPAGAAGPALPVEKRMESLRRSAMMVVEDLFENPSPENISRSVKAVSSFVHVLMKDPQAYLLLSKLSSHDPYTLQHSVGTAVNSIILGRKIGIKTEQELLELGMGGLLHDLGKTKVKKEIINKEGPLDPQEWEEMRGHALWGWEIICDNPDVALASKRAILEHHEEESGKGYPHGKTTPDIHPYARIVCLSDVFNALTTNRSYSKARTPFDAFQLMRDKLMHKIDPGLFSELVKIYGGKLPEPTP